MVAEDHRIAATPGWILRRCQALRNKQAAKLTARQRHEQGLSVPRTSGTGWMNGGDFIKAEFPALKLMAGNWLVEEDLVLLVGETGIGKSWFALAFAIALALGRGFLGWRVSRPWKVGYLDAEMPKEVGQKRIRQFVDPADYDQFAANFRIIAPYLAPDGVFDISTPEGRAFIEESLKGMDIGILDNFSALSPSGDENSAEDWKPIQEWLKRMRIKGLTIILVHHSGKNGVQRGTSARLDILNTVLYLKKPSNYKPENGAHVVLSWGKNRGFFGSAAKPLEARLVEQGERLGWEVVEEPTKPINAAETGSRTERNRRIRELRASGMTQQEITDEVGVAKSTVSKTLKKDKA